MKMLAPLLSLIAVLMLVPEAQARGHRHHHESHDDECDEDDDECEEEREREREREEEREEERREAAEDRRDREDDQRDWDEDRRDDEAEAREDEEEDREMARRLRYRRSPRLLFRGGFWTSAFSSPYQLTVIPPSGNQTVTTYEDGQRLNSLGGFFSFGFRKNFTERFGLATELSLGMGAAADPTASLASGVDPQFSLGEVMMGRLDALMVWGPLGRLYLAPLLSVTIQGANGRTGSIAGYEFESRFQGAAQLKLGAGFGVGFRMGSKEQVDMGLRFSVNQDGLFFMSAGLGFELVGPPSRPERRAHRSHDARVHRRRHYHHRD